MACHVEHECMYCGYTCNHTRWKKHETFLQCGFCSHETVLKLQKEPVSSSTMVDLDKKKIATLEKQNANLQKQTVRLQKKLEDANQKLKQQKERARLANGALLATESKLLTCEHELATAKKSIHGAKIIYEAQLEELHGRAAASRSIVKALQEQRNEFMLRLDKKTSECDNLRVMNHQFQMTTQFVLEMVSQSVSGGGEEEEN